MILSIVNTRQGYSQFKEFIVNINMPNLSNKLYKHYHNEIFNHINEQKCLQPKNKK